VTCTVTVIYKLQ